MNICEWKSSISNKKKAVLDSVFNSRVFNQYKIFPCNLGEWANSPFCAPIACVVSVCCLLYTVSVQCSPHSTVHCLVFYWSPGLTLNVLLLLQKPSNIDQTDLPSCTVHWSEMSRLFAEWEQFNYSNEAVQCISRSNKSISFWIYWMHLNEVVWCPIR